MFLTVNTIDFGFWIQKERERKGWSQADLARHSGLHRAVISKVESGTKPMPDTLTALAKAFEISPITIFRQAGLLPPGGDKARLEDLNHAVSKMTDEELDELFDYIEMRAKRKREKEHHKDDRGLKTLPHPRKAG